MRTAPKADPVDEISPRCARAVGRLAPGVARSGEPLLAPAEAPREQGEHGQQGAQREQPEGDQEADGRAVVRAGRAARAPAATGGAESVTGGAGATVGVGVASGAGAGCRRRGAGAGRGVRRLRGRRGGRGRRRSAPAATAWCRRRASGRRAAPSPLVAGLRRRVLLEAVLRGRARARAAPPRPRGGRRASSSSMSGVICLQRPAIDGDRVVAGLDRRVGAVVVIDLLRLARQLRRGPGGQRGRAVRAPPRGPRSSGRAHREGTDGLVSLSAA